MSKDPIDFSDFVKLDIALGTVTAVEIVPDADKLLKLTVDVGEDVPRQIMSAIREYLDEPQFLVGKQFPFLLNIPPRTIRGYESQGMILAASTDSDELALLEPSIKTPTGTRIM